MNKILLIAASTIVALSTSSITAACPFSSEVQAAARAKLAKMKADKEGREYIKVGGKKYTIVSKGTKDPNVPVFKNGGNKKGIQRCTTGIENGQIAEGEF